MDVMAESCFVRACIKKEYRERIQFELQSKKHRQKAMSRFAHDCVGILQGGYQTVTASELARVLDAVSEKEPCYLITDGAGDGTDMPMQKARELLQNAYMPVILISPGFFVIKPEAEDGRAEYYVFAKGEAR